MEFKTAELRHFINKTRSIKPNNILPILSMIKYDDGVLTKTNLETYFLSEISTKYKQPFLIDEKILLAKLKEIDSETITIEVKDNFIVLNGKTKFPTMSVSEYPNPPELKNMEKVVIDSETIKAVGYFGSLTMISDQPHNLSYVHVTKNGIFASNNFSFVNREVTLELVDVLLSREACSLLSEYSEVEYYTSDNYNFFSSKTDSIAFIKPTAKTPVEAFSRVINGGEKEVSAEFDKKDFLLFCDFVSAVTPALLPECKLSIKDKKLSLTLNDSSYDISDSRDMDVVGAFEMDSFTFNPKVFSQYLKSIPYSLIRFSPHSQNGAITVWTVEDDKFNGVLVGII
jgi:hypothetical protein